MAYIKHGTKAFDKNGTEVHHGDILRNYFNDLFVCIRYPEPDDYGNDGEIRDYVGWNVCMCDLGPDGDVISHGRDLSGLEPRERDWYYRSFPEFKPKEGDTK